MVTSLSSQSTSTWVSPFSATTVNSASAGSVTTICRPSDSVVPSVGVLSRYAVAGCICVFLCGQVFAPVADGCGLAQPGPALFLVGEHEVIYSPDKAVAWLKRVAPSVTAEIVRDAGHDRTMVQAEAVSGDRPCIKYMKGGRRRGGTAVSQVQVADRQRPLTRVTGTPMLTLCLPGYCQSGRPVRKTSGRA